jgi:hypothetical protein
VAGYSYLLVEQGLVVYVVRVVAVKATDDTLILIEKTLIILMFRNAGSDNIRLAERNLFTHIAFMVTGELAPLPEACFSSLHAVIFEEKIRSWNI